MTEHVSLGALDVLVIVVYMVLVIAAGTWVGGHARSTREFFFGGQRFSWWVITASCIATLVGSYSFLKYSEAGYLYGLNSASTYLNDWFLMPLWMFGWLPIIYYSRVESIPEYFVRRFGPGVRHVNTLLILLYLLTGISYNFYTLGVVGQQLFGTPVFLGTLVVGVVAGSYVTFGGQNTVILTDLIQAGFLLLMGLLVAVLGVYQLGGFQAFWDAFPDGHKYALGPFNTPPEYNAVGIFWTDGIVGGVAFYFFNQGMMLRFLSARSVEDARKAAAVLIVVAMPITAVAVASAGWIGAAMTQVTGPDGHSLLDPATDAKEVFTTVTRMLFTAPGAYGLVIAALVAALMSTVEVLINATASILVNDVFKPLRPLATARELVGWARVSSIVATIAGLLLSQTYEAFDTLYEANAFLKAAIPPPIAAAVLLGAFWRRATAPAVLTAMVAAMVATAVSFGWPQIVEPFAHGTPWDPEGNPAKQFVYIRGFFSFAIAMVVGVGLSLLTPAEPEEKLTGLVTERMSGHRERYKGGPPKERSKRPERVVVRCGAEGAEGFDADGRPLVTVSPALAEALGLEVGDLLFAEHPNPIYGGLRSGCFRVGAVGGDAQLLLGPDAAALLRMSSGATVLAWRWM